MIWKLEGMWDSGLLGTLKLDRPRSISTKVSGKKFLGRFWDVSGMLETEKGSWVVMENYTKVVRFGSKVERVEKVIVGVESMCRGAVRIRLSLK